MSNIAFLSGATGAGKTATAAAIGAGMALRGQRVRGVDLDHQCTLTIYLNREVDPDEPGEYYIGDVLLQRRRVKVPDSKDKRIVTIADAERTTDIANLTVVPANTNLKHDNIRMAQEGAAAVLRPALDAAPPVDVTLLDGPGEINSLSIAAIMAADKIVVIVCPDVKHADTNELISTIEKMRERGQTTAEIVAVVPCIVPSARDGDFYGEIMTHLRSPAGYPDLITETEIRRSVYEPRAYSHQQPLPVVFPGADVTKDYAQLLLEFDRRGITPHPSPTVAGEPIPVE